MSVFRLKRGARGDLPPSGETGEPLVALDTLELFVVDGGGAVQPVRLRSTSLIRPLRLLSNINATVTGGDALVAYTALTASRTLTLPPASSVGPGFLVRVCDFSGAASSSRTLGVQRSGTNTVNGSTGRVVVVKTARGSALVISDGISKWYTA